MRCAICAAEMVDSDSTRSRSTGRAFFLAHCPDCQFSCVTNPRADFDAIYDESYYRGEGVDPLVDYEQEMFDNKTIRQYEWRGVLKAVGSIAGVVQQSAWLDFGCGLGGFVRFLRGRGFERAYGFDEGYAASALKEAEIPSLSPGELAQSAGRFDVVTAIEVLEHAVDPVGMLRTIASVLRPGGLLFVTTGNARPFRDRLSRWPYVQPDVHVSYFEPETLARAMKLAGLAPAFPGYVEGWNDIIRYKVLKELGVRRGGIVDAVVPWGIVARIANQRRGVSAQPIGWRVSD